MKIYLFKMVQELLCGSPLNYHIIFEGGYFLTNLVVLKQFPKDLTSGFFPNMLKTVTAFLTVRRKSEQTGNQ